MDENRTPAPEEQSLNEVLQIRRDKLRELQAAGKDPFELVKYVRTANSAEIINNFEAMEGQGLLCRFDGPGRKNPDLCQN